MKIKIGMLLIVVCAICSLYYNKSKNVSELVLLNIEALANDETDSYYDCYGTGSLDCVGDKVYTIATPFRLHF